MVTIVATSTCVVPSLVGTSIICRTVRARCCCGVGFFSFLSLSFLPFLTGAVGTGPAESRKMSFKFRATSTASVFFRGKTLSSLATVEPISSLATSGSISSKSDGLARMISARVRRSATTMIFCLTGVGGGGGTGRWGFWSFSFFGLGFRAAGFFGLNRSLRIFASERGSACLTGMMRISGSPSTSPIVSCAISSSMLSSSRRVAEMIRALACLSTAMVTGGGVLGLNMPSSETDAPAGLLPGVFGSACESVCGGSSSTSGAGATSSVPPCWAGSLSVITIGLLLI